MADRVLGVDACKAGWVGVLLGAGPSVFAAGHIAQLVAAAEPTWPCAIWT